MYNVLYMNVYRFTEYVCICKCFSSECESISIVNVQCFSNMRESVSLVSVRVSQYLSPTWPLI